jgi:hypothetical protein
MIVQWEQVALTEISAAPELDRVLDELAERTPEEHPILVDLIHPVGGTLAIGIGGAVSVLSHVPASGDPPYLVSIGNETATGEIGFYGYGEWSEFSREDCVPNAVARQVARDFLATGELSQQVRWRRA